MNAQQAPHAPAGRILAVASGKGGVGKTFISASLAQAFARRGERVLVFDGDLGMANVDVQLGLTPPHDLSAVVTGERELKDAVTPAMGGAGAGGFDVIAGRSGSGAMAGISKEEAASLAAALAGLSLKYDRVLVDLAAGVEPSLMRLCMSADDVLVVLMDEPTSMTDAYAFVKMLRLRDDSAEPFVALNMSETFNQARGAYEGFAKTCTTFLGFTPEYAGTVRRDSRAKDAIRRQKPLFERAPDSQAAGDVSRLAAFLAGDPAARAA